MHDHRACARNDTNLRRGDVLAEGWRRVGDCGDCDVVRGGGETSDAEDWERRGQAAQGQGRVDTSGVERTDGPWVGDSHGDVRSNDRDGASIRHGCGNQCGAVVARNGQVAGARLG